MLLSKMILPWFVFKKINYLPLQKQAFPNNYLPQHTDKQNPFSINIVVRGFTILKEFFWTLQLQQVQK